ncbi:MAG TPA: hypothetical protein ENL12_04660 [Dehalococcoidia bacterium]|nr:hypothetical protein [Dehalococcoidia bacterium]
MKEQTGRHEEIETRKMRRRMLLYYTRDGLWDICIGICVLGWALAIRYDFIAFIGVIVAVTFVPVLKQRLTYPRIGYARLKPDSGTRKLLAVFVALGAAVLFLVLVAGAGLQAMLRDYLPLWLGVMGALLVAVIGHVLGTTRFYVHALLVFLAGAAAQWAGVELWVVVTLAGAAIIAIGGYVLVRFLREHPVSGEAQDA